MRLRLLSLIILSSCFLLNTAEASKTSSGESLDQIIVLVNDMPITESELRAAVVLAKKQMNPAQLSKLSKENLDKQILEQMINRRLELQVAEMAGIHTTDKEVDQAITRIAESNHVDSKTLLEKVKEEGVPATDYKTQLREEITIQKAAQIEVGSHITITPEEVTEYLHSTDWKKYHDNEYHLEDILVTLPENPSPEEITQAKETAELLIKKVHAGKAFDATELEDSETPNLQGGDLGWRQLAQIPPAFAEPLVHLQIDEIMGPIATPNGFHIVKLSGIRHIHQKQNLADETKEVQQLIFQRKMEEGVQAWIARLRSSAFINMHPE